MISKPRALIRDAPDAGSTPKHDSSVDQGFSSSRAHRCLQVVCRETLAHAPHGAGPRLLAILATPPLMTPGERTLARVRMAAEIIGCTSVVVQNLLGIATKDVREIAAVGKASEDWLATRESLETDIAIADSVLLAWGCSEPTGPARHHHRAQVAWIMNALKMRGLPYWTFGGQPRHPSRWQRYTSREHPGSPFSTALAASLQLEQAVRD